MTELPAHDHVGFNDFPGSFQVRAGFVHVEPNRVNFVAGGLGQTVAGHGAGIDLLAGDSQRAMGLNRPIDYSHHHAGDEELDAGDFDTRRRETDVVDLPRWGVTWLASGQSKAPNTDSDSCRTLVM